MNNHNLENNHNRSENEHSHNHQGGHNHSHSHFHSYNHIHSADENILTAFFLNLFFVFVEIIGGFLTNSFAILSDAIHDFGDCVAIGFAYFMEKLSQKSPDEKYTYGYRRYSLISAIVTSLILVLGSVFIIAGAVKRFGEPKEIQGVGMLIIAVFGVIINGVAVLRTHKGFSANEKAISMHLLEDVLGWIAVLIGAVLIFFFDWYFIDSVLSMLIAGFLLFESTKNIVEVFGIFLEKTPVNVDVNQVKKLIGEIDGVEDVHHVHIWSLDGQKNMATLHVKIGDMPTIELYKKVKARVQDICVNSGIEHLTLQIDIEGECSLDNCGI